MAKRIKLVFELIGTVIMVLMAISLIREKEGEDAAFLIGYCIGMGLGTVCCWLAIEFCRRVWRVLRRYDAVATAAAVALLTIGIAASISLPAHAEPAKAYEVCGPLIDLKASKGIDLDEWKVNMNCWLRVMAAKVRRGEDLDVVECFTVDALEGHVDQCNRDFPGVMQHGQTTAILRGSN